MAQVATEREERAAAATTANPAPLGLSAFALTTFVLSAVNAGFVTGKPAAGGAIVMGLALFYGGVAQWIAGIQEFRAGNTFGATAFVSYGSFWLAFGFILYPGSGILASFKVASDLNAALAYFLLGWTIFTAYMFVGTLRSNLALMAVFGVLTLTFAALAIAEFSGGPVAFGGNSSGDTWTTIGGYLGILTAILAWYTALAGVLASGAATFKLPVGPRT